jgi:hypothetical protein
MGSPRWFSLPPRRRFQSDPHRGRQGARPIRQAAQRPLGRGELRQPAGDFADLGEFDIIALHGVYRWVAPAVRRAIIQFADARLKTGGALFVSYNAAPGWMPRAPLQRLLFEAVKRNSVEPRTATADALRFAKSMKDAGAFYFQANPQVGTFLESMQGMDLAYLVHEHLNESWSALYHADVVADFSATTLSYACAAHIADDLDETSIPIATHAILPSISDSVWRETVKDFLVGRSFRRDIFVRGPVKLTQTERMKALDRIFMLVVPRSPATAKIPTPMGEVEGRGDLYPVLLDLLASGPIAIARARYRPGQGCGRPPPGPGSSGPLRPRQDDPPGCQDRPGPGTRPQPRTGARDRGRQGHSGHGGARDRHGHRSRLGGFRIVAGNRARLRA